MKFIELMEGAEPKLPGAPSGIQIMTPQQFVAKSAAGEEPEPEEGVKEGFSDIVKGIKRTIKGKEHPDVVAAKHAGRAMGHYNQGDIKAGDKETQRYVKTRDMHLKAKGVAEGLGDTKTEVVDKYKGWKFEIETQEEDDRYVTFYGAVSPDGKYHSLPKRATKEQFRQFVDSKSMTEATKLAAPTRPIGDPELTDYLDRIRTQQKKKTDKYKLPYIHRSSVMGYYNAEGKKYNVDAIKAALAERPKSLLKKNEKMKHSDGTDEQFFNIGFAALVGIALDEQTNELIVVNTCPGAGSCKIDCFAMKGGKIQFQGPWLSDGRILTYLLNDPQGFFNQLKSEIDNEVKKGAKKGYKVSIRWHDAGDFFSPEYVDMAFNLAKSLPDVDFYAYTKVADVALGDKPDNFMINWSEGASASQEKKVKGADPELEKTKNSRIVPNNLFYDLLVKDEKKNLVKGPEGQWQVIPDKLPELKQRLAKEYGLSPNSILSYSEWENKVKGKDKSPLKYNVIITPGEPDLTAKDAGVLSTLLLKH